MADITNPQVVRFCNEELRPTGDRYITLYWWAKSTVDKWTAGNLAASCPSTADFVADGSDTDGRGRLTGTLVNGAIATLQAFIADLEVNSNQKLNALMTIAVNPRGVS